MVVRCMQLGWLIRHAVFFQSLLNCNIIFIVFFFLLKYYIIGQTTLSKGKGTIVLPRSNDHVCITLNWHIHQSGVLWKLFDISLYSSVGGVAGSRNCIYFPLCTSSNLINAFISFSSFLELGICSISATLESYICFRNFYTLKK